MASQRSIGYNKDENAEGVKAVFYLKTGSMVGVEAHRINITERGGTLIEIKVQPKEGQKKGVLQYVDPSLVAAILTETE